MRRRRWNTQYKLLVLSVTTFSIVLLLMRESSGKEAVDISQDNAVHDQGTLKLTAESRSLFAAVDASADGKLSKKEIMWNIQKKVRQHMQSAIRGNMKNFFILDKLHPNGQVDWDEWQESLLRTQGDVNQQSRAFKEQLAAARAAWKEAARSNPEGLNIDEFLSFTHAEFSHPLMIQEAEDLVDLLDSNGDGMLSLEEYLVRTREDEKALKRTSFKDSDSDSNGLLTRNEIMASLDPKSEIWAKQQAEKVMAICDRDNDGFVDESEFIWETFSSLSSPETLFHQVF